MNDKRPRKTREPSPPTMIDVARRAGVSAMSVSRALRAPDTVSSEVRERVARAIRDTGFVPNQLAGGLRSMGASRLVACIVPSLHNSLFSVTLQGIADELRERGLNLIVGDSGRSQDREESLIESFVGQRPRGFILHETVHTTRARRLIEQSGVPVVEVGDLARRPLGSVVSYSNADASAAMTRYLIERGYRRIGFVTIDERGNIRARHRRQGYERALRSAGIALDPRLVLEVEAGYRGGGEALVALRERAPDMDAVFFAGDVLAIGALLEARRRGWNVPRDTAIASFDDFEIASWIEPRLTAVDITRYEIGRTAARIIVDGPPAGSPRAIVDVGFAIRGAQSA